MNRGLSVSALVLLTAWVGLAGAADTQQRAALRHVGVLLVGFSSESKEAQAFRQGLRDVGYAEGRDVVIDWRYAAGDYTQVPRLAADLVERKVDVIVTETTVATRAAKQATSIIPIVIALAADPVGSGLVTSLAHPGGNVTGLSMMIPDLVAKRLQLFKEAVPGATRVAVFWDPATPPHAKEVQKLKGAALALSIEVVLIALSGAQDFGPALSAVNRNHAQALYILDGPITSTYSREFLALASKSRLPAVYGARSFVEEGALMSYGANIADMFRLSAGYVGRILRGAKPADLPIEQPTKLNLVVNLKTAKALGITIPESILLRADEVIR